MLLYTGVEIREKKWGSVEQLHGVLVLWSLEQILLQGCASLQWSQRRPSSPDLLGDGAHRESHPYIRMS